MWLVTIYTVWNRNPIQDTHISSGFYKYFYHTSELILVIISLSGFFNLRIWTQEVFCPFHVAICIKIFRWEFTRQLVHWFSCRQKLILSFTWATGLPEVYLWSSVRRTLNGTSRTQGLQKLYAWLSLVDLDQLHRMSNFRNRLLMLSLGS